MYERRRSHHDTKRFAKAWCARAEKVFSKFQEDVFWLHPWAKMGVMGDIEVWKAFTTCTVEEHYMHLMWQDLEAPKLCGWYRRLIEDSPHEIEPYLSLRDKNSARIVTHLRAAHCFEIEELRFHNIPRPQRYCRLCMPQAH